MRSASNDRTNASTASRQASVNPGQRAAPRRRAVMRPSVRSAHAMFTARAPREAPARPRDDGTGVRTGRPAYTRRPRRSRESGTAPRPRATRPARSAARRARETPGMRVRVAVRPRAAVARQASDVVQQVGVGQSARRNDFSHDVGHASRPAFVFSGVVNTRRHGRRSGRRPPETSLNRPRHAAFVCTVFSLYSDAICIQIRPESPYCRKGFQICIQCIQRIPTPPLFAFFLF